MRRGVCLLRVSVLTLVAVLVAGGLSSSSARGEGASQVNDRTPSRKSAHLSRAPFVFPLKVSGNRRYLVDARGRPYFVVGDSPQAIIGNLQVGRCCHVHREPEESRFQFAARGPALREYTGCRDDATTIDGIPPFTTPGDLSTPNPKYFATADAIVRLAERSGIAVFLDPIETGGWLRSATSERYEEGVCLRAVCRSKI